MAVRTISTRIALDGEAEFKKSMSSINGELRNLKSELRYSEEAFKGQANSTEALTAKSELLRKEIDQQEEKVKALSQAVVDSSAAYGEADGRTDKYRASLNNARADLVKMQRELQDTEKYLKEAEDSMDGCASSIDEFGKEVKDVKSPLEDFKEQLGQFKNMIVGGAIVKGIKEVAGAVLELEESTREYRQIMGTLEVSAEQAGYSAEETAEAYDHLYSVLGDAQSTATTLANLQAVGLEQDELLDLINQCVGAWGRYGDSIPIDGLAEAVNETIRAGQITGVFADVINWGAAENENFGVTLKENIEFTELSKKELEKLTDQQREQYEATKEQYDAIEEYNEGVTDATTAEDKFNIALADCETQAERTQLVIDTLTQMGLAQAGEAWRDVNQDIVTANDSQNRMEKAMGRLGEAIAPAANAIRNVGAGAIEYFAGVVESAITLVQNFIGWWEKFQNTKEGREAEARKINQRTGLDWEVNPDTSKYSTGPSDNSAWNSHALGLEWVPYDGYKAELHKGEAVLTAEENRALNTLVSGVWGGGKSAAAMTAAGSASADDKPIQITTQVVLDGNKVGESVTTYQKNRERAMGR